MKVTKAHFGEPSKVKLQLNIVKERLWSAIPYSAKEFPWRKAEDVLFKRLLLVGQKAFKWSLITLFLFSSLSDVMFSISRNRELMIPFGLLVGCLMTDFLKEISMEVFQAPEENPGKWRDTDKIGSRHLGGSFVDAALISRGSGQQQFKSVKNDLLLVRNNNRSLKCMHIKCSGPQPINTEYK
ncbi:unnamed protein product [Dovyalis caffra]|uniref:Uncharacterized protein n=1 Tax=Dovyalis caffra TaxID=77055 RepID=A0AAV1S901_9ROSI|nr:unnamed protein product [Dovyalis caffra]